MNDVYIGKEDLKILTKINDALYECLLTDCQSSFVIDGTKYLLTPSDGQFKVSTGGLCRFKVNRLGQTGSMVLAELYTKLSMYRECYSF